MVRLVMLVMSKSLLLCPRLLCRQVSGSHDHSVRVWERTQEPLVLSEQKELVGEAKSQ